MLVPQATNDLRDYQARAPGNLRYNTREKTYLAGPDFRPLFGEPSAEAWLRDAEAPHGLPVESMPLPARRLAPLGAAAAGAGAAGRRST